MPSHRDALLGGAQTAFDHFDLYAHGRRYDLFYDLAGNAYITNPYAHFRIDYVKIGPTGISEWTIVDGSGVEYTFTGIPAVGRGGYRYHPITRAVDPNGNEIRYEYADRDDKPTSAVSPAEGRRRLLFMTATHHHHHHSPLGPLLLIADDRERLCGVYLPDHDPPPAVPPGRRRTGGVIDAAAAQLDAYFAGTRTTFDLPLATAGAPLHERVWERLRAVPYGATTTYGQIAAELGLGRGAARAVGTANARNPLAIVVPCHRVVGSSGALAGYAGGLEAKRRLLVHEARVAGHALDLDDDASWALVERRDAAADERFLVGVRTAGAYCAASDSTRSSIAMISLPAST